MPKPLTIQEAASLRSAFLSAYFCLMGKSRLKPAQKPLIHDASGDVGQAAIMLAQRLGADILEATYNRVVDVVLRSKSGRLHRLIGLVAPQGWFIKVGRKVWWKATSCWCCRRSLAAFP